MKRITKLFGLILTMMLMCGIATTVFAADDSTIIGSKNMKATFDGNKFINDFGSISELVNQMEPGDSVQFEIEIENKSSKKTDFYMWNKVIKSFEKNSIANGGAYTYDLTYTNGDGKTEEIYSSDTVGGLDLTAGREGLHEATLNLEEWFYLFTLDAKDSGFVTLVVTLDGETQGNDYQNTLADIDFRFACEGPDGKPEEPTKRKVVKTGDDFNMLPYAGLMAGSGILLLAILMFTNRKKGGEDVNA